MGKGWKRNRVAWGDDLARVSWQEFERLVGEMFEADGYRVEHCGTGGTGQRFDGGVDLVLRRPGETVLVQCKHWNAAQVPHNDVHQLIGIIETRGASAGIVVTSGEFTPAARDAASRARRVSLIDGAELRARLGLPAPGPRHATGRDAGWASVADKALDAGMFLATRGAWSRRGRPARSLRDEITLMLVRVAIAAVIGVLLLAFVRHQLGAVREAVTQPFAPPAATAAPSSRPAAPSGPAGRAPPVRYASTPMTAEQLEEEKRKNAEAMEILERTTPSVHD